MKITRREFLTLTGTTAAGLLLSSCAGPAVRPVIGKAHRMKVDYTTQITTICPYCAVGCGVIVLREEDNSPILSVEGDPDHPINEGALCSKGSALYQLHSIVERDGKVVPNPNRLTQPLYRAAGASKWKPISWSEAIKGIARRIKKTRDANFTTKKGGKVLNRTTAIANLGGAALDNEECYLLSKLTRSLGIVYLEHQARI